MTEEALKLAQDAGFWREHTNTWMCSSEDIERLVDLIRADEREACAKVCEGQDDGDTRFRYDYRRGAIDWADAIRARGNT